MENVAYKPQWAATHWKAQSLGLIFLAFLSFYQEAFHYWEYLFFLFLVAAIGVAVYQRNSVWIRSPLDLPLGLLVGWILITIPFSLDPAYSFSEWRKLVAFLLPFYWASLVLQHNPCPDYWRSVVRAMLVGMFAVSLYVVIVFFGEGGTLIDREVRAGSVSIELSTLLTMAIPVAIVCYLWAKNRVEHWLLGGVVCLVLLADFFTYSRAGYLALLAIVIAFGIMRDSRRAVALTVLFVAATTSFLFGLSHLGYLGGVFVPATLIDRVNCWAVGVQAFYNSPIVGVGFGPKIFGQLPADLYGQCKQFLIQIDVHNTYIMYAMGSGGPALIFLLWMFATVIRKFSQDARDGKHTETASVKLAIALAVLGYGVAMIFSCTFSKHPAYVFCILVAIGFSLSDQKERPAHDASASP